MSFAVGKADCHDTGCCHGPCGPRKSAADKILIVATVLMALNVGVYLTIHRHMGPSFAFVHGHEERHDEAPADHH